jgi:predicted DNA-binding protein YlxM (UPF0122 family)
MSRPKIIRIIHYKGADLTLNEFAEAVNIKPGTIDQWIRKKRHDLFIKKLGFIPKVTRIQMKAHREEAKSVIEKSKKKRYHIVYQKDEQGIDSIGLCVGFGHNKDEAIEDFLKSREDSCYEYEVLHATTNRYEALNHESMMIRKETMKHPPTLQVPNIW